MFTVVVRYPKEMLQKNENTLFYLGRMALDYGADSVTSETEIAGGDVDVKSGLVNVTRVVFHDGRFGMFVELVSKICERYTDESLAVDNPDSPLLKPPLTGRGYRIDVETVVGSFGSVIDDEEALS